ncbi:hypothetical protein [Streptomyces sp. CA2R101]|uniref:hypothetical protein n=1 Tax=Streptomyces sp. CA2R101 TaxID=3120152 RepID=UPI00300A45EC
MTGTVTFGQKMSIGRIALPISEGHYALVFLDRQSTRERQLIAEQPHGHSPHGIPDGLISTVVDSRRVTLTGEVIAPY